MQPEQINNIIEAVFYLGLVISLMVFVYKMRNK